MSHLLNGLRMIDETVIVEADDRCLPRWVDQPPVNDVNKIHIGAHQTENPAG